VKLLAYDISRDVENRRVAFRDIEALIKMLSDEGAVERARRLRTRAGVDRLTALDKRITAIAKDYAAQGFRKFKAWAEAPAQGIVLTAHPTFSLSRDIRDTLGEIASLPGGTYDKQCKHLKTLPYLPTRAPTLQEEHVDAQAAIARIQEAVADLNSRILDVARKAFPDDWTKITPQLVSVYSWVGYDIDGRTDISWGDAIRLRLSEKSEQLGRYLDHALALQSKGKLDASGERALDQLVDKLSDAKESAERDLALFAKDLSDPENLVAAANNLTRVSTRRLLNVSKVTPLINKAIKGAATAKLARDLIGLRALMASFGLGTSRIHFRLNERHVISAVRQVFGIKDRGADNRTLLERASRVTKNVKPVQVNFASLELEKSTAHQQMMLTAQIHKYIDDETPIRLLIAETEDSLVPLGMLYIAKTYGLENHLDISPLFETADALNNGGRIISKMLANPVYRDYVESRGVFAIQTGFSDAGRFMGQIPATLAIERLQSHFAQEMKRHGVKNVSAIVFNTHGEGAGRGGHPGTIRERVDYAMSPWAIHQFEKRGIHLTHETSFQGGDGYMWFQTPDLAKASVFSLIEVRHDDRSESEDDVFYTDRDFSWDMFRTIGSEQDSLYNDPNYVGLLGGFGQNMLIPTGSRAAKRAKSGNGSDMFNPRQLRAIPHNAILQQFGTPANIFYGVGRASSIDVDKFLSHLKNSARMRSCFGLVIATLQRTDISILTAYGRLFDPGFWVSRGLSGTEPVLAEKSLIVAETLKNSGWRNQLVDLATRLRMDMYEAKAAFGQAEPKIQLEGKDESLQILHALRLAVVMKMLIVATDLPANGAEQSSQLNVLQRLQTFQVDGIIAELENRYPARTEGLDWTKRLSEKTAIPAGGGNSFPHISESIVKPLGRAAQLARQATIAITHRFDAYG
jgi:phosphoenolpyruvate carboxylase